MIFWHDLATRYKNHPNVIFGLYNEPHDVPWEVWRNGGMVTDIPAKLEPRPDENHDTIPWACRSFMTRSARPARKMS